MSKIIEIRQNFTFGQMAQEDPQVKAWFDQAFRPVGPYYQGKVTATGLNFDEQKLLLPYILGIEPSDKAFRNEVSKHYDNILTLVPPQGLKLEVGLEDDSRPLSDTNLPLNIKDYITYRHAKGHPGMAVDEEEGQRFMQTKKFYLVDTDKITAGTIAISELEDKALAVYFEYKDNQIKVDQVLTMSGIVIRNLTPNEKQIKFKALATKDKDNTKSQSEQGEAFNRFINLCRDEDLPLKFMVEELIGAQILERIGTNVLLKETGATLGEDMRAAILFLKNPKNSKTLNVLKAEYQTKVKKETSLAPETIEEREVKK